MNVANIPIAMGELLDISRRFPNEKIWVGFQNGAVTVGFPKGEYGDQQTRAWVEALGKIGIANDN